MTLLSSSIDDQPLATNMSQLLWDFPYDRVSDDNIMKWCARPDVTLLLVLFYLLSKPILESAVKTTGFKSNTTLFRTFVAVHNLSLAVFSATVLYKVLEALFTGLTSNGLEYIYCDQSRSFWRDGHGLWATLFYLSKFYEFIDTWILVLKGKKASFLQVYHHTGAIITVWAGVVCQSPWLAHATVLNTFIHTLMYSYFFIKTLYPNVDIPLAKVLTMAQITQFITGVITSLPHFYMPNKCDTEASLYSLGLLHVYGYGLIVLFVKFAQKRYPRKDAEEDKKVA